ncbi:hypothetical protein HOY82DRAFT_613885 [Tuber indicum]|nr:hypothetical protein HOY82DRAFT_613885 [Tuber indicum]
MGTISAELLSSSSSFRPSPPGPTPLGSTISCVTRAKGPFRRDLRGWKVVERLVQPRQLGRAAIRPLADSVFALPQETGGEVVAVPPAHQPYVFRLHLRMCKARHSFAQEVVGRVKGQEGGILLASFFGDHGGDRGGCMIQGDVARSLLVMTADRNNKVRRELVIFLSMYVKRNKGKFLAPAFEKMGQERDNLTSVPSAQTIKGLRPSVQSGVSIIGASLEIGQALQIVVDYQSPLGQYARYISEETSWP